MVENIGELHGQSHTDAFRELDLFCQGGVQVPIVHATKVVDAAAVSVIAQDAATEIVVQRFRIVEHVEVKRSDRPDTVRPDASSNQVRVISVVRVDGQCGLERAA